MSESSVRIAQQASGPYLGAGAMRSVDGSGNSVLAQHVRQTAKPATWGLPRTNISAADSVNVTSAAPSGTEYTAVADETKLHFGIIVDNMSAFTSAVITPVLMDSSTVRIVLPPITISKPATPLLNGGTASSSAGFLPGGTVDCAGFNGVFFHITALTTTAPIHIRTALV